MICKYIAINPVCTCYHKPLKFLYFKCHQHHPRLLYKTGSNHFDEVSTKNFVILSSIIPFRGSFNVAWALKALKGRHWPETLEKGKEKKNKKAHQIVTIQMK